VQSLRFAFVHWRVSQRYGQSLTDGTLLGRCLRRWRQAQAAQRMYNRSVARRVLAALRTLLRTRAAARHTLLRDRALQVRPSPSNTLIPLLSN